MQNQNLNESVYQYILDQILSMNIKPGDKIQEAKLASELGISKTTLVKIEQQKANPTLDTVALIAQNMGCDPISLLGNTNTCNYFTAMLLMNLLNQGHQYSLDTLQQAVNHLQAALDLLLAAQQSTNKTTESSD